MTFSSPALQWSILDSTKYRTVDLSLEMAIQWGSSGAITSRFMELIAWKTSHSLFSISTTAGTPLWDIPSSGVLALGFTPLNQVITVLDSAKWNVYSDYNGRFKQFRLPTALEIQLKQVKFSSNGNFMALTSNNDFIHIKSDTDYQILSNSELVNNWWFNEDSSFNHLTLIQTENELCILDTDLQLKLSSDVLFLDISPNLKLIAVVTIDNKLTILDSQLKQIVSHDVQIQNLTALKWCGSDSITLAFNDHLEIYGPSQNKYLTIYPPNMNPIISTSINGVFVLTSTSLQYISKVPEPIENVFNLGSTHPAAILLDTFDLFERKDPNLNKNLKLINDSMTLAVDTCIRAAAQEFNPFWQRKLLRAASFGKSFLEFYNPLEFTETCSIIQVLNNLRSPEVGIFLNFDEFQSLGVDHLIDILLLRNLHSLAIEISHKLNSPNFKILTHWAQATIQNHQDSTDDVLLDLITGKIMDKSVSWIDIAKFAHIEGRNYLAKKLVLKENDIKSKCELLINMNEPLLALANSCEMFNIDPIIFILLNIKQEMSLIEFYKVLNQSKLSQEVWKVYLSGYFSAKELNDFYYQNEDYINLILDGVEDFEKLNYQKLISYAKSSTDDKMKPILHSLELKLQCTEIQTQLLEKYPSISIGEPIIVTIQKLQKIDFQLSLAIAKKCKVPNGEFTQAYLDTISNSTSDEELSNLLEFSNTNIGKSIKPEEYYSKLIQFGFKRHASMYILQFKSDQRFQLKAMIICGLHQEALTLANALNEDEIAHAVKQLIL